MLCNPHSQLLLSESISSINELSELMNKESLDEILAKLRKSAENDRIKKSINASQWGDEDKMKAVIASRYLNSIGKGENALELSVSLKDNFELPVGDEKKQSFEVPPYIREALTWLLQ